MKLWPSRSQAKGEMVADLDALLSEPVSFRLHGRVHEIRPIGTAEFFKFTNAYSKLWDQTEKLTADELVNRYYELTSSVCSSISKDDIKKMTQAQVGALFQLLIETVTGRAQVDEKKTLQAMKATARSLSTPLS